MTHYQKLATMAFRLVGALLMFGSAYAGVIYFIFRLGFITYWDWRYIVAAGIYSFPPLVMGLFFFGASRRLARWVCFDLDRDE